MVNRMSRMVVKILLPVLILLLLVTGVISFMNIRSTVKALNSSVDSQVEWISAYADQVYSTLLIRGLSSAEVLIGAINQFMDRNAGREEILAAVKAPLELQDWAVGSWVTFASDAFDGRDSDFAGNPYYTSDGAFASYWYRDGDDLALSNLEGYESEGYFLGAYQSSKPRMTDAYEYEVDTGVLTLITIALPIIRDGKTIGVAGIDIDISSSQELISSINPFETGYAAILSDSGVVIAHPDSSIIMKSSSKLFTNPEEASAAIAKHEPYLEMVKNEKDISSMIKVSSFTMKEFEKTLNVLVSLPLTEINNEIRMAMRNGFIIAFVSLLLAMGIFIPLLRRMIKPVRDSAKAIEDIAAGAGDLTQRLKVESNDEVGKLSESFNRFIEAQNDFIKGLKEKAQRTEAAKNVVVSASEETSANIQEISANIESIGKQMEIVIQQVNTSAASIEETNAAVQSIDKQIENQANMVEETSSSINEISATLNSTSNIARQRAEAAKELNSRVDEGRGILEEATLAMQKTVNNLEAIEAMNQVMSNISSQTNLLSMNAAIEAAHAGESGKGFAVVAEEIRKLAEQAGNSSRQINSSVHTISDSINHSSNVLQRSASVFEKITIEANTTGRALEEIYSSVEEMNVGGTEIMNSTQRLRDSVLLVKDGFQEIVSSSNQILTANNQLRNVSETTEQGIQEIRIGIAGIVRASTELVEVSGHLDNEVVDLRDQVQHYITD